MPLSVYKSNQGRYTRSLTALGIIIILGAICYYVYGLLINYVPTDRPLLGMPVPNATVGDWRFAKDWPTTAQPVYRAGDLVTAEARKRLDDEKVATWDFQAAHPFPLALYIQDGLPMLLFLLGGLGAFLLVNWPRFADFLIATESEMKKVSWSTQQELIGSTLVVIVTVVLLGFLIGGLDIFWAWCLKLIGALPGR